MKQLIETVIKWSKSKLLFRVNLGSFNQFVSDVGKYIPWLNQQNKLFV